MKQKMMEEQRKNKSGQSSIKEENVDDKKEDVDHEVTEEIKTEEMMYSENESHTSSSDSDSDSSSS
jgi:hypothetical protein